MEKEIKGVIFDVDGTLLDSLWIWEGLGKRYLASLGIEAPDDLNDILRDMSFDNAVKYITKNYGVDKTPEDHMDGILSMLATFYIDEVESIEVAENLAKEFYDKGIPMILATEGDKDLSKAALQRLGIYHMFSGMLSASELDTDKHSPDIYLKGAELLGLECSEILVVEDKQYAIDTASLAGFMVKKVGK